MSNVTPINQNLPIMAELGAFVGQSDLRTGVTPSLAVLSIRQGKFHIKHKKQEIPLTDTLPDGGKVAKTHLDVVLLGVSPHPRRQYYAKPWNPASPPAAPDCYSNDGQYPAPEVQSRQAENCAICPKSKYGSKITDRGKATACPESKRAAVVPLADLTNESFGGPVMLNVPFMSMTKLKDLADALDRDYGGLQYNCVAVRLGFDPTVEYLRLSFTPIRPLTPDELGLIKNHYIAPAGEINAVNRVLNVKPAEEVEAQPQAQAQAQAQTQAPTPTSAPVQAPASAEAPTVVTTEALEDELVAELDASIPSTEPQPAPAEPQKKRRGRKPKGTSAPAKQETEEAQPTQASINPIW